MPPIIPAIDKIHTSKIKIEIRRDFFKPIASIVPNSPILSIKLAERLCVSAVNIKTYKMPLITMNCALNKSLTCCHEGLSVFQFLTSKFKLFSLKTEFNLFSIFLIS